MSLTTARDVASFELPGRDLADEQTPKTFTEDEHLAVLADRVSKETAALTTELEAEKAKVTALDAEKTELASKLDIAEAAKLAAETELAETKTAADKAAETAKVRDERKDAVKEIAGEEFCTEARIERWSEMDQAAFDALVEDLKDAVPAKGAGKTPPRDSAAFSGQAPPAGGTDNSGSRLISALRG